MPVSVSFLMFFCQIRLEYLNIVNNLTITLVLFILGSSTFVFDRCKNSPELVLLPP